MPTISQGALVLVTGASGFIAIHVVEELLRQGFRVRGTVRTEEKGEFLKSTFKEAGERFQYIIVEDLQKVDGFTDAVKDVEGILHIASPLYRTAPTGVWENIIEPAKQGTTSVLYSTLNHNPNVKRIVITSSYIAAADQTLDSGTTFNDKDWNTPAKDLALKMGNHLDPISAYAASKILAEEAAWTFMKTNEPSFDLTTILPPLVCGPIKHVVHSPRFLNTSSFELWHLLSGNKEDPTAFARNNPTMPMVDVRDVAWAHVEALLRPEAGNRRIPVSNGVHRYQEFLDVIHDIPELVERFPNASWGEPGTSNYDSVWYGLDATVSQDILDLKYRDWKQTIIDTIYSLLEYGRQQGWKISH